MFIHAGGLHPVFARGDYLKSLLKNAYRLGVRPNELRITGFLPEDDIPIYFGAADVIVLNYMRGSASASGAAHRAVAAHKPIVKTDDICIGEIPGHMVSRGDSKALMEGIEKVLGDKSYQLELIKWEDELASQTSWEKIAQLHKKSAYN
jgi:hypothetical protein